MNTVMIFGATGTVGAYSCLHFIERGYKVVAVGNRKNDNGFFSDYNIEYYSVDITKKEEFEKLPNEKIAAVVHLAGMLPARMKGYAPQRYIDINITGTLNVLEFCVKIGTSKVIYSQSISDVDHLVGNRIPISSDADTSFPLNNDHSIYSITKNAAVDMLKHYAEKFNFEYYVLRFPNIYLYHPNPYYYVDGELKWQGYRKMIDMASKGHGLSIWGNPKKVRDIVYVKDCCQIIEKCISSPNAESGTYNVGTGVGVSIEEQVKGIAKIFAPIGKKIEITYDSSKPDTPEYIFDISKTESKLGYKPHYNYISYLKDFKTEMEKNTFRKLWGDPIE